MTVMTQDEIEALLDGTTPGPWQADGEPWNRIVWSSAENRVCFMAHSNGLDDARDIATSNLAAAAPDLARTALALHAQLADAKAAQTMVVERAAAKADRGHGTYCRARGRDPEKYVSAFYLMAREIRALAPIDGLALVRELRDRAEKAEARLDRHLSIFADHAAVVWGIIRAAGDLPTLNDGPFKEGFISGMEEVAARGDIQAADGNHQLQDLCEQIIALVTGEATLIMAKPEVVVRKMAAEADCDRLAAANAALEAKVAGLVEAAKPFVDVAELFNSGEVEGVGASDTLSLWLNGDDEDPAWRAMDFKIGDFGKLQVAIETQEAGT